MSQNSVSCMYLSWSGGPGFCSIGLCVFYAMTLYVLCLVAQLCLTLCNLMGCSLPGSSVQGDSPGKNSGVNCHGLFQGIFPTQGSNPNLLHCRWILYCLSHQGSLWHCILPLYSIAWKQKCDVSCFVLPEDSFDYLRSFVVPHNF